MKTNFPNNAMGIYWDAVNLMTAEYRDVLVKLACAISDSFAKTSIAEASASSFPSPMTSVLDVYANIRCISGVIIKIVIPC